MGGGTATGTTNYVQTWGPSPRGRGNRLADIGHFGDAGTIHAWAGEPSCQQNQCREPGDHPRVGGGTTFEPVLADKVSGPSPRGRGNPMQVVLPSGLIGTIPAWAGEPNAGTVTPNISGDHPRVGGGTIPLRRLTPDMAGPSPRGRGNRNCRKGCDTLTGTIPAWAGEPRAGHRLFGLEGDHPRVGGGTSVMPNSICLARGPSPRGRGNP